MRCFYCGLEKPSGSKEHVVSAHLGGRLVTRKVCKECNTGAGGAIDEPISSFVNVGIPKALNDVRHSRRAGKPAGVLEVDASTSTGTPVVVRFSPAGMQVIDSSGNVLETESVGGLELSYGFGSDEWVRFGAKVALGCISRIAPDEWLDSELAKSLQILLRGGAINPNLWPTPGVQAFPVPLPAEHAIVHALGPGRHMVALIAAEAEPQSAVLGIYLFGGELTYHLALRGFEVEGSGRAWVLDPSPGPPPQDEDCEDAIERLLREQAYSDERINELRTEEPWRFQEVDTKDPFWQAGERARENGFRERDRLGLGTPSERAAEVERAAAQREAAER